MSQKLVNNFKLGKKAPVLDKRTFKLAKYLKKVTPSTPTPPLEGSWVTHVPSWPMYLNDNLGDCVIAAMGHCVQQWTFYVKEKVTNTGSTVIFNDDVILKAYEKVGGYNPADPSTDQGCDMLTALKYWRNTGLGGHKILAFMKVDPTNAVELETAIWLFGNVFAGFALPASAQNQTAWTVTDGGTSSVSGTPNSWGGHCVPLVAYSPKSITCVTWGSTLKMSRNFCLDYCDEAYVALSSDWVTKTQVAPSLFNLAQLQADLANL